MNLVEEIKGKIEMEMRPASRGVEYLEAVIDRRELESLKSLLVKHMGPPAKRPGEEGRFPGEIQEIVDSLGGLWAEQSFYYRQERTKLIYAALWPWQTNPEKTTLKVGEFGRKAP